MSRRDERRRKVEGAFAEFRRAVAAALGAASREHRQLADERAGPDHPDPLARPQHVTPAFGDDHELGAGRPLDGEVGP